MVDAILSWLTDSTNERGGHAASRGGEMAGVHDGKWRPVDDRPEIPRIGIGMLGYGFMGRIHTNALQRIPAFVSPPPAIPVLHSVCGRREDNVAAFARRHGFEGYCLDWQDLVADPGCQVLINLSPNDTHSEPSLAAAAAGKHVLCEKPLARTSDEAYAMWRGAERAGVKHLTGFNSRFVPAVVLARDLIRSGRLGKIYHWRARCLHESYLPHYARPFAWRQSRAAAGSGALGDLGSHIIDLAHFLVGDIGSVSSLARTFIPHRRRPNGEMANVDVDDAFLTLVEFANGAIGTLEASRVSAGSKNQLAIEVDGELGSLRFDLLRLNELQLFTFDDSGDATVALPGFRTVLVTEGDHPWLKLWWPRGHVLGWEHSFVHQMAHWLACIVENRSVGPDAATFEDGYRVAVVSDAILASAERKIQVQVTYAAE
jgi:predicted dehydrogenase